MATVIEESTTPGAASSVGEAASRSPAIAVAVATLAILAVYAETTWSIVSIWLRSETFAHGFVVIPIALWLAWRKRDELAATTAAPWLPGLFLVAVAGALWAMMTVGDVQVGKQYSLAFMLQAAIVTIVGLRVARVLAFPLVFLLFAVPAGEALVPTLIEWTADFTVNALRASGVPVYREANHFVIPSGSWSVVEACSGLRYLIASFMTGVLFAAIVYRSPIRRVAFIGASILVPLVANWLRAYLIVMLGHLSGNKIAVGVDHLIYGWIFFGVVLLLLFWVGSLWSEQDPAPVSRNAISPAVPGAPLGVARSRFVVAAALAVAVAALWRPIPSNIETGSTANGATLQRLGNAGGWTPSESVPLGWRPDYKGMSAELVQEFTRGSEAAVLYVAQYRGQAKGREMITAANALVSPGSRVWREQSRGAAQIDWNGTPASANRSEVSGMGTRMIVYSLYWVNGSVTSSASKAKLLLMLSRLRGLGDDSMLIITHAAETPGRDAARELLNAYAPVLDASFHKLRQAGR